MLGTGTHLQQVRIQAEFAVHQIVSPDLFAVQARALHVCLLQLRSGALKTGLDFLEQKANWCSIVGVVAMDNAGVVVTVVKRKIFSRPASPSSPCLWFSR